MDSGADGDRTRDPLDCQSNSVVLPDSWCSGKVNEIEGKSKWFSLLFHPVLACYGSKMVAEKEFFLKNVSWNFFRPFQTLPLPYLKKYSF